MLCLTKGLFIYIAFLRHTLKTKTNLTYLQNDVRADVANRCWKHVTHRGTLLKELELAMFFLEYILSGHLGFLTVYV